MQPEVRAAVAALSTRRRAVIVLTYWADLAPATVADLLGHNVSCAGGSYCPPGADPVRALGLAWDGPAALRVATASPDAPAYPTDFTVTRLPSG